MEPSFLALSFRKTAKTHKNCGIRTVTRSRKLRLIYYNKAVYNNNQKKLKIIFMKHKYITLQILIAAKMNRKNNAVKQVAKPGAATHFIL